MRSPGHRRVTRVDAYEVSSNQALGPDDFTSSIVLCCIVLYDLKSRQLDIIVSG